MTATIPGWTPEMERLFKEVLFRFLEEVHSTKAALYLLAEDGSYLLVTQYGFGRRDQLAAELSAQHPMVLIARRLRTRAQAFNGPDEVPEMAEYLRGAGTARLLVTPLYGGSRLVGLVDARDKGRKAPFTEGDKASAGMIAATFLELMERHQLYTDLREARSAEVPTPQQRTEQVPERKEPVGFDSKALDELRRSFRIAQQVPGVRGIVWTICGGDAAHTVLEGPSPVGEDEVLAAREHHRDLVGTAVGDLPDAWTTDVVVLDSDGGGERELADGDVLLLDESWLLAVSVLGPVGSSAPRAVLELLRSSARLLQRVAVSERRWRGVARKLLTPGEQGYPELVTHSENVSRLAWRMAAVMGEGDETMELAAVAGLLHDVGMRELDYPRLYRHPSPGPAERRLYTRHPVIGERLLREAGLDELATVVRHHHERWDGEGHPDRLSGEAIPHLSRLVHVAEVFDTLTSDNSYRRPMPIREAISVLRSASKAQFDPEMVDVLERVAR